MTRSDFSLLLITTTLILFACQLDLPTLLALVTACVFHLVTIIAPYALDSKADDLRSELNEALSTHAADIKLLKDKVDMLNLQRAGR